MSREKMALGSLLARAFRGLPRQLSEGIVSRLKLPLRLQYYRAQGLADPDICRIMGIPPAPEAEWLSLLAIYGRSAQLETLAEVHPLQSLLCLLHDRFAGPETEADQLVRYCQPILRYLAVVDGAGRDRFPAFFNRLLSQIYSLLSLDFLHLLVWADNDVQLNTGIFASLLRAGRVSDAVSFGRMHQINGGILTVLACEFRDSRILSLFGSPNIVIEAYTVDILPAATAEVVGREEVSGKLIFDLGYSGKYAYLPKIAPGFWGDFLLGALLAGHSDTVLFDLLPYFEVDHIFYDYASLALREDSPYRLQNGLPKSWQEMLRAQPLLRNIFFWLAAWAGQTTELAEILQPLQELPEFIVSSFGYLLYAPTPVYRLPLLQQFQEIVVVDMPEGGGPKNVEFFRAFPELHFYTLDGTGLSPEVFAAQLDRVHQIGWSVGNYLNHHSLQLVNWNSAWERMFAVPVGESADVADLWIFRRLFREACAPRYGQIWAALAEVGTPLTLRLTPGMAHLGRADLGRFSDPETDIDVGRRIVELLNR